MSDTPFASAWSDYAGEGIPIIPLKPRGKAPLTKNGYKDATSDPEILAVWAEKWPDANIGIRTGRMSGLLVLDVDPPKGGIESLKKLEAEEGSCASDWEVASGDGSHRYFRDRSSLELRNTTGEIGGKPYPGLDIRGEGGYIVAPPSIHPNGNAYRWVKQEGEAPFAPIFLYKPPKKEANKPLAPLTQPGTPSSVALAYAEAVLEREIKALSSTTEGSRNDALNRAGFNLGTLIGAGVLDRELAEEHLWAAATANGLIDDPEDGEDKVRSTIASGLNAGIDKPRDLSHLDAHGSKSETQGGRKQPSQSDLLLELAEKARLFHNQDGEGYACVPVGDRWETYKISNGKGFRGWLTGEYYKARRSAPNAQSLSEALATLEARAKYEGEPRQVFVRLGHLGDRVYLDLGRSDWSVVEISAGGWEVLKESPILFERPQGLLPLPLPERDGLIDDLFDLMNIRKKDRALLLGWLVMCFHPKGPYPILVLSGEQGTGKSSLARLLKNLLDPGKAGIRKEPSSLQDLVLAANNSWLLAFDNISRISGDLSDALCRMSTGSGFATRKLYANDEEVLFEASRPMLVNGIGDFITRSDLMDRSIVLVLSKIAKDQRKTEAEIRVLFEKGHGRLLGAILDGVCGALCRLAEVKLEELPRMADFALWATAAEPGLGLPNDSFMRAYLDNQKNGHRVILDASPVGIAIERLLKKRPGGKWKGTPTELRDALFPLVDEQLLRYFPKIPKTLTDSINRIAPNLRALGIETEHRSSNGKTYWIISKVEDG